MKIFSNITEAPHLKRIGTVHSESVVPRRTLITVASVARENVAQGLQSLSKHRVSVTCRSLMFATQFNKESLLRVVQRFVRLQC